MTSKIAQEARGNPLFAKKKIKCVSKSKSGHIDHKKTLGSFLLSIQAPSQERGALPCGQLKSRKAAKQRSKAV